MITLSIFQATELVGGDLVRQMKWPHVTPKSSGTPIIARLEKGRISTEKDKSFDSRMEFLYKNVVSHLFNWALYFWKIYFVQFCCSSKIKIRWTLTVEYFMQLKQTNKDNYKILFFFKPFGNYKLCHSFIDRVRLKPL